jgi:hypothetical protein
MTSTSPHSSLDEISRFKRSLFILPALLVLFFVLAWDYSKCCVSLTSLPNYEELSAVIPFARQQSEMASPDRVTHVSPTFCSGFSIIYKYSRRVHFAYYSLSGQPSESTTIRTAWHHANCPSSHDNVRKITIIFLFSARGKGLCSLESYMNGCHKSK